MLFYASGPFVGLSAIVASGNRSSASDLPDALTEHSFIVKLVFWWSNTTLTLNETFNQSTLMDFADR